MVKTRIVKAKFVPHSTLIVTLIFLLSLTLLAFQSRPEPPSTSDPVHIAFPHSSHLNAGITCLFCHPGATERAVAGLPSTEKCVGCHRHIEVTDTKAQTTIQTLLQTYQEERPLQWKRVYDLPDFVRFTHQPHLAAAFNCEDCHGNVRAMAEARQAYRINMGFCLDCHRQQSPEQQDVLQSCSTCHY